MHSLIFVTGGAGFISANFVIDWLLAEYRPRAVVNRPGHNHRYAIDATRIEGEPGWRPAETFETGIRKTMRWRLDGARLERDRPRTARLAPVPGEYAELFALKKTNGY